MRSFPEPIHNAAAALGKLPSVGPKTALRYTYALLRLSRTEIEQVAQAIHALGNVSMCQRCFMYTSREICAICHDTTRSSTQLCIVAESRDISTLEATDAYKGKYFVLGGTLSPMDGRTPETLHITQLKKRLADDQGIEECILALSPDVYGETTMMYLTRLLKPLQKKITRLARGLPTGADIEYADEVTLASALTGRSESL